jgi:hypothetical protein
LQHASPLLLAFQVLDPGGDEVGDRHEPAAGCQCFLLA